MLREQDHLPVEIFGFVPENRSQIEQCYTNRTCPFVGSRCIKAPYRTNKPPNGSCTVSHLGKPHIICPKRFLEDDKGLLLAEAHHHFGEDANIVLMPEVKLEQHLGQIDWVAAKLDAGSEVGDFIGMEIMANQTTSTGPLTDALEEFEQTGRFSRTHYGYGLNTYMQVKTFFTQCLVKGKVFEAWSKKYVWIMQDVLFDNWMKRTKARLSKKGNGKSIVFAVYKLVFDAKASRYRLRLRERHYASYRELVEVYSRTEIPDLHHFLRRLKQKARAANNQL
jgi:hypothetical protein